MPDANNINPATSDNHLESAPAPLETSKSESLDVAGQPAASNFTCETATTAIAFLQLVQKQLHNAGEYSLDQLHIQLNGRIKWHSNPARYEIRAEKRAATVSIHLHETNTASNNSFQRLVDNIITINNKLEHGVSLNNHRLHVTVRFKGALNTLTEAEANDTAAGVARTYMQLRAATAPHL